MSTIVFNGREFAQQRELDLAAYITKNRLTPRIASVVFKEDAGSMLYTRLKHQAAVRVGIDFSVEQMSIIEPVETIANRLKIYDRRRDIHGLMIQKPMKDTWEYYHKASKSVFDSWWMRLVDCINPTKDADCLTLINLNKVYNRTWKIVPATVKAVISILNEASSTYQLFGLRQNFHLNGVRIVVLGRSEIVGRPLSALLEQYGASIQMYGTQVDYQSLGTADVVISATGVPGLIKEHQIKPGAVVIDVGAPRGDVDELVRYKASFITPVPGGVGPVTVISLLENLVELMME